MVHPAALAISFGIALGGAIFALFYLNNRNENNQWRYQERERRNFHQYYSHHLEADTCSICLDRFDDDDDNVVHLECLHRFHTRCIEEGLRHSNLCPNCRQVARIHIRTID